MRAPWWKGGRGEWYVVIQAFLFVLIAVGPRSWGGWPRRPLPDSGMAGWVLFGLGVGLGLAAVGEFGSQLTILPHPAAGGRLVQTGAYRLVRHPMYCGALLAGFGWALVRHGWLTLGYAALLFVLFDLKARREESWLMERYPEYPEYRVRVRRLIPFLY